MLIRLRAHFSSLTRPSRRLLGWLLLGGGLCALAPVAMANPDRDDEKSDKPFTADDLTEEQKDSIVKPPPDRPLNLREGEKLIYEIGWSWFDVGRAELTVVKDIMRGQTVWRMELQARTNGFADAFYKVRNTTRSWMSLDMARTVHYEAIQREGDRERDVIVEFGPDGTSAQYRNLLNNDARAPIPIIPGTWDPMGITYFVRSLPLAVGETYIIPTTTGKELFLTEVRVAKMTSRKFKISKQKQDAYLLMPNIKDLGGVFRKSEDSSVRMWISADERQIPLRMESEVAVGSFWAELVRIETVEGASTEPR